ncbi:Heat stress transcription factor B-4, partial [Mucuna pruriens]
MALLLDNCESILLSLDTHKSVPAPFLTKTYQLVDDPSTDHIVSWGEDDTTFVVWRPPEFARDLLPNYFKHNNFSSFVRQLNTYGFRKIVPDRWEFANEFFKKGEKQLLCEIHRRKTPHQQHQQVQGMNHQHQFGVLNVPPFFPFHNRLSVSPPNDSDELANWCDSPPRGVGITANNDNYNTVAALCEDNERLRRSNNMLMSELAHMKKLYNDIIYFVQNHVKPVAPSNTFPTFLQASPTLQRPVKHFVGCYSNNTSTNQARAANSPTNSSITIVDEERSSNSCKTKLFGVSLQSKKRVHPEYNIQTSETNNRPRFVLEKDELGLNLMPPSTC